MMKYLIILNLAWAFQLSSQALADDSLRSCTPRCIELEAIPVMQKAVVAANSGVSSPGCPAPGIERITSAHDIGKSYNSKGKIQDFIDASSAEHSRYVNDPSHCGGCKQVNLVSTFSTISPNQPKPDVICEKPFARNFFGEDLTDKQIASFASGIMQGGSDQGKEFAAACPSDTCNMYTASAITPTTQDKSRINLTVYCGPPRMGNFITATYDLTMGFVHQWVCTK